MMNTLSSVAPIIPRPVTTEARPGVFTLSPQTIIVTDAANAWNAAYLRNLLHRASGLPLPITVDDGAHRTIIRLMAGVENGWGSEGYRLTVSEQEVALEAQTASGVFYAVQSLRQLLPVEIESNQVLEDRDWSIPCVVICDKPRFGWRGHMLDVGRHFHNKATILRTLDLMALHKLNVFHWHLTEDQGWRMESKRFPRLTEIGSVRPGTRYGLFGKHDGVPHGGFYTHTDIKEVVEYAAQRNICVVPEIDLPGHSLAALTAYPAFSCRGGPFQLACGPGIYRDIFCAGKEATFAFLGELLDELIELFPSPYVHIGGDEAPKTRWRACPDCQRRMRQERLGNPYELQRYFTNRLARHLARHDRRAIVWNDALDEQLDESVIVQYWARRCKAVSEAARNGRDVINSSHWHLYINYSYTLTPLRKVFDFDPLFPELQGDASHILGLEAPLWCEWVANTARIDYQSYPRLSAAAECGWSPHNYRDYTDFRRRLNRLLERLRLLGVGHAPLSEVEPSWLRQRLGVFDMARPLLF